MFIQVYFYAFRLNILICDDSPLLNCYGMRKMWAETNLEPFDPIAKRDIEIPKGSY